MTASNYPHLKIVNWDFIGKLNPRELRKNKDPTAINKIINNFLSSSSLFADPSFCPPDMVLKYFQLLQIAVADVVNENTMLNQKVEDLQKKKKQKPPAQQKKVEYILPPVVFQCQFCAKLFKTRKYLGDHILRRHSNQINSFPAEYSQSNQPNTQTVIRTIQNIPEQSQDLGPFKAEVDAMIDHFDTLLRRGRINMRAEFTERLNKIDQSLEETKRRDQELAMMRMHRFDDASYSDSEAMNEKNRHGDSSSDTPVYPSEDEMKGFPMTIPNNSDSYSYNQNQNPFQTPNQTESPVLTSQQKSPSQNQTTSNDQSTSNDKTNSTTNTPSSSPNRASQSTQSSTISNNTGQTNSYSYYSD